MQSYEGRQRGSERENRGAEDQSIWKVVFPLADVIVLKAIGIISVEEGLCDRVGRHGHVADIFRFSMPSGLSFATCTGQPETGVLTQHLGNYFAPEDHGEMVSVSSGFRAPLGVETEGECELLARGGAGFAGYYQKPEMTNEKLEDGWFSTGDAVTMKENGELVFLDRVSDLRRLSMDICSPAVH